MATGRNFAESDREPWRTPRAGHEHLPDSPARLGHSIGPHVSERAKLRSRPCRQWSVAPSRKEMTLGHGARVQHELHLRAADCVFADFFRCNDLAFDINTDTAGCAEEGYFTFGGAICFGRPFTGTIAKYMNGAPLPDVPLNVDVGPSGLRMPFDVSQVVTNLRRER